MRTILAVIAVLLLAGCSLSPKPVVTPPPKPRIDRPDSGSMKKCTAPVLIGSTVLTQEQAERLWGMDTDSLIECARRHQILINFVNKRDSGLTGSGR